MSELIRDIHTEFREFWDLPIVKDDVGYKKTHFDEINISLILNRLIENKASDDLVMVLPPDRSITPTIIIESLLSLLKLDILESSTDVLKDIKPGDPVAVIEKGQLVPGEYCGIEVTGGKKVYLVRLNNSRKTKYGIPAEERWQIQPYMSYESNEKKKRTELAGGSLEKLCGLPPGGIMAFQKSRMFVVTSDKNGLVDDLRSIRLGDTAFEDIFPVANYVYGDSWETIGRNKLRRKPVLCLTSSMDIAADTMVKDSETRLVIVDSAAKVRSAYGSIALVNANKYPKKIICLLKTQDEEEIKTLISMGFDSWIWKRSDFSRISCSYVVNETNNHMFALHQAIIECLSGTTPEFVDLHIPDSLAVSVATVGRILSELNNRLPSTQEAGLLMQKSFSFYNYLLQLPVPLSTYDGHLTKLYGGQADTMEKRYLYLTEKAVDLFGVSLPSDLMSLFRTYLNEAKILYDLLKEENEKYKFLVDLATNGTSDNTLVICMNKDCATLLTSLIKNPKLQFIPASVAGLEPDNDAVVTAWFNWRIASKFLLAPYRRIRYLVYNRERDLYKFVNNRHIASGNTNADVKLRSRYSNVKNFPSTESEEEKSVADLLEKINERYKAVFTTGYSESMQPSDKTVDAIKIIFEDDSYVFITEGLKLDKLDRRTNMVIRCCSSDIQVGDELIFTSNNRSMFEDLLSLLKSSEKYGELWKKSGKWREALLEYANNKDTNSELLSLDLEASGCKRHPVTIKSWLDGAVIGPSENNYEAIHAILRMTDNQELGKDVNEVIDSCKRLHALHVSAGRELVRRIVKSTVLSDDAELSQETKEKISEYAKSAKIETVIYVDRDKCAVPAHVINTILRI